VSFARVTTTNRGARSRESPRPTLARRRDCTRAVEGGARATGV